MTGLGKNEMMPEAGMPWSVRLTKGFKGLHDLTLFVARSNLIR